jgi:Bifunctional DNA primase/polymerase, N-terminal
VSVSRYSLAKPAPQWELKRAALSYVTHDWPVVPAAFFDGDRYTCVQVDCVEDGPHPVWRMWQDRATTDPGTVSSWYRLFSFAVALPTGTLFDVLEVPELPATRLQAALAEAGTQTPTAVWRERDCRLFWVSPGMELDQRLADAGIRLRAEGNWVPAPPTPTRRGPVQWAVNPDQVRWTIAAHEEVLAVAETLGSGLRAVDGGAR